MCIPGFYSYHPANVVDADVMRRRMTRFTFVQEEDTRSSLGNELRFSRSKSPSVRGEQSDFSFSRLTQWVVDEGEEEDW